MLTHADLDLGPYERRMDAYADAAAAHVILDGLFADRPEVWAFVDNGGVDFPRMLAATDFEWWERDALHAAQSAYQGKGPCTLQTLMNAAPPVFACVLDAVQRFRSGIRFEEYRGRWSVIGGHETLGLKFSVTSSGVIPPEVVTRLRQLAAAPRV